MRHNQREAAAAIGAAGLLSRYLNAPMFVNFIGVGAQKS